MLNRTTQNIADVTISTIGAITGIWLAYFFTYSFPLIILPAIVLVLYCCFRLSLNISTALYTFSIKYSQADKALFFTTKRKANAILFILFFASLFACLITYGYAKQKFDDKELALYGKRTTAIIYDYKSARKGHSHRSVQYYFRYGNRNYQGDYRSSTLQVGDTIAVIYSTHIPEINRVISINPGSGTYISEPK